MASSANPHQPAQPSELDASIELERAIQDGVVTERSRSDRPGAFICPQPQPSEARQDVNLLMIDEPPSAMVPR